MSWKERFSAKMNRSSWKTAHEDYHPHPQSNWELLNHFNSHHLDLLQKLESENPNLWEQCKDSPRVIHEIHQAIHLNPSDMETYGYSDHEHSEFHIDVPDKIPSHFAHNDYHPQIDDENDLDSHLMTHHDGDFIGDIDDHEHFHSDPSDYLLRAKHMGFSVKNHDPDHYHSEDYRHVEIPDSLPQSFASFNKISDPGSLRGEGISGMIDPDGEVVGPEDLDSNATEVDKFPTSVGVFKNSSWKTAHDDMHPEPLGPWELKNHIETHHQNIINQLAPHLTLDDYINSNINHGNMFSVHEHSHTNPEGQRIFGESDHEHGDYNLSEGIFDHIPKHMAAGGSEFGNPIDGNNNRMQSVESPGLEIRTPLDTGKRNYSEQRADANPLTLRSWFTGDDVNGPWPHTKNLSGPLDFEPTDNQNEDSTGPVMSSFQSRYAHDDHHPWPWDNHGATEHLVDGHHEELINFIMKERGHTRDQVVASARQHQAFSTNNGSGRISALDGHIAMHKQSRLRSKYPPTHEHDDDFNIDVPDDIETIAPTYVTSSWHQSFVETFDTHPDEESPDTLLNPADELKNGRPRSTDSPQQSAQLLPGMLIDHDQMGGSGTASGSF